MAPANTQGSLGVSPCAPETLETPVFTPPPGATCQPLGSWVVSVVFPASLLFSVLSTHGLQELSALGALPPPLPPAPCPSGVGRGC